MVLQTINGYPELILMESCEVNIFFATAEWLTKKLSISYSPKIVQEENICWEFSYSNSLIMACYDPIAGIILHPAARLNSTEADKAAFMQLKHVIEST